MAGFFSGRENEETWHSFPMVTFKTDDLEDLPTLMMALMNDGDSYNSSLQVLTTLSGNPHITYWRFWHTMI